jgi:hypothetical protein
MLGHRLGKYRGKVVGKGSDAKAFDRRNCALGARWFVKAVPPRSTRPVWDQLDSLDSCPAPPTEKSFFFPSSPQSMTVVMEQKKTVSVTGYRTRI